MKRILIATAVAALSFAASTAAMAASDYLLVIGGKDGVAPATIEISSWSWGVSNSTSTVSGGNSRLRESPSLPSRPGGARVASGDLNGDGQADLAAASEVQGFTLGLDKSSPRLESACVSGNHLHQATISARGESYELIDVVVTGCSANPPASAKAGGPPRAHWDLATMKGGRSASLGSGSACASGVCSASTMSMTITGQLKHTKSGHVTLLK